MRLKTAFLGLAALSLADPATPTPPPPEVYVAYGPRGACVAGYAIEARENEALSVTGERSGAANHGVVLYTDRYWLALRPDVGFAAPEGAPSIELDVPGKGRVRRFDVPARRADGRSAAIPAHSLYLLPAGHGGDGLWAISTMLRGSEEDLQLLTRIRPASAADAACSSFVPPYAGAEPQALYWSPVVEPGPGFRCQNGIGFAIGETEGLALPWRHSEQARVWSRLVSGGRPLALLGPTASVRTNSDAAGPVAAGYRITESRSPHGSRLELIPPGRRSDEDGRLIIEFPSGAEQAARDFAGRLVFVRHGDPRCSAGQGERG